MVYSNEDLERMRRNLNISDEELIQYVNEKNLDYYVSVDSYGATMEINADKTENLHNKTFREILDFMYDENNHKRRKYRAEDFRRVDKKYPLEWIYCKVCDEVVNVSENEKAGPYIEEDKKYNLYNLYLKVSYEGVRIVPDIHP